MKIHFQLKIKGRLEDPTMLLLKKITLGILFLVLWAGSLEAMVQISTYANEWRMEGNSSFSNGFKIVHDDEAFLYMICANRKFPAEAFCKATLETPTATRSWLKTVCQVKIVPAEGRELVLLHKKLSANLERLGKNRAVIYWKEADKGSNNDPKYLKFMILDLSDCSQVQLPEIIDSHIISLDSNIIVYNNSFDLIVPNKSMCKGVYLCRLSFNEQGQQFGEPMEIGIEINGAVVNPISSTSGNEGFCVYKLSPKSDRNLALDHIDATGKTNSLVYITKVTQFTGMEFSNAYKTCSVCFALRDNNKQVECYKFDASSNMKSNPFVEFDEPVKALAVYNLPEDVMLVASLDYDEETHEVRGFDLAKILPNGTADAIVYKVTGLNLKCADIRQMPQGIWTGISETSHHYCFYFTCSTNPSGPKGSSVAKYARQCIKKQRDFCFF